MARFRVQRCSTGGSVARMLGVVRGIAALAAVVLVGAAVPVAWDVGESARSGQLTIYNRSSGGSTLGFPLAGGDVNGDGRADLILTPMNADSGPARERPSAGEAVILLSQGSIGGERNLAELDPAALPADAMLIYGADAYDYLGTEVASADLDGDGYADAIIGAQHGDGPNNQRDECGEVAIVWGGPDLGGRLLDLNAPPAGAVTFVYGADLGDRLGVWVSAGDFDGDGVRDAILGADESDGPAHARPNAGATIVVYGGTALRARASVDLAAPEVPVTQIFGIDRGDHSGATVRGFDVDGDGVGDVLIGAGLNRLSATAQSGPNAPFGEGFGGGDGPLNVCDPVGLACEIGEAYVVYGGRGERPASLDLAAPPVSTTIIYGIGRGDAWGEELWAGDFDGDGHGDVAIGALTADGPDNARSAAGALALIRGGAGSLRGAVIELSQPRDGLTIIEGARRSAIAGDTALLLDLDGDGKDELVVASPGDQPRGRVTAGSVTVFFGTAEAWPAVIDLAAVPQSLAHIEIDGASGGDQLAYSMGLGDVNGDGLADLILNAMGADGFEDSQPTAGDSYVLDAVALSRAAGREPVPTPTPVRCAGDCDGDGAVAIAELITGVNLALDGAAPAACPAFDRNADGAVDISELIAAVANALSGCPE